MTDTARVLLTAALLSSTAFAVYVWPLARTDPSGPERLVGQLRLAQWMALVLAGSGAVSIGLAVANDGMPFGTIDVTFGVAFVVLAAWVMQREPREALMLSALGLLLHALADIAHRPGGLPALAPHWYDVGCAIYDVYLAALCYWATRR